MCMQLTDLSQKPDKSVGEAIVVSGNYGANLMKYVHAWLFSQILGDMRYYHYRRIATFSTYEKPSSYTYAFDKLPKDRAWGVSRPFDDKSMLLCKSGINEPYIVWIVGRVSRTWFFDKESNPASQVSINVVPINDSMGTAVRHLLSTILKPAIGMCLALDSSHS